MENLVKAIAFLVAGIFAFLIVGNIKPQTSRPPDNYDIREQTKESVERVNNIYKSRL